MPFGAHLTVAHVEPCALNGSVCIKGLRDERGEIVQQLLRLLEHEMRLYLLRRLEPCNPARFVAYPQFGGMQEPHQVTKSLLVNLVIPENVMLVPSDKPIVTDS